MILRTANVYLNDILAGRLTESKEGYQFVYDRRFLETAESLPVSITLPLSERPYYSKELFPFFRGLIPEGWFFDLTARTLKIDPQDEFGMLLRTGRDCIGAVSLRDAGEDL